MVFRKNRSVIPINIRLIKLLMFTKNLKERETPS